MALFMDLHKASDYDVKPTIEEIKRNHIADLKTQEKYGVRFIQYWVNEEAGLVFCLMDGPDKESCIATHQEAHGNIACNMIELKGGDYKVFMGNASANEFDIVENIDGTFDTGHRSILMADIITLSNSTLPLEIFNEVAGEFGGRTANHSNARIIAVFNSPSQAIECAKTLQYKFKDLKTDKVEIRLGINSGEPVTERNEFFGDTIQLTNWLCDISLNGQISISTHMMERCKGMFSKTDDNEKNFKVLSPSDERFLNTFMTTIQPMLSNDVITIEKLSKSVGISRVQLYRKITFLTGHPPNNFIQELRLKKALGLVMQKYGNIAEIAFESGFNSPSYFAKSFQKRFGSLPAQILKFVQAD